MGREVDWNHGRTRRALALLLGLLLSLLPLEPGPSADPAHSTEPGWLGGAVAAASSGTLLAPRGPSLNRVDAASGEERPLHNAAGLVLSAAWSPDGSSIAFAQFGKKAGDRYGGSDLFLLNGGQATLVVPRSGPDQTLTNVAWTADGQGLVYQEAGVTASVTIAYAGLATSEQRLLQRDAGSPAVSPDGQWLTFVRYGESDSLVVRPLWGGPETSLLPPDRFYGLASPRFSPDGRQIAFLGVGGPTGRRPAGPPAALASLRLGPAAARAHGLPYDPWVVNFDGSGLRLVAPLSEDDPGLAWSPDGATLAVLGGGGLWLMPLDGGDPPRLLAPGAYGTLDWRP